MNKRVTVSTIKHLLRTCLATILLCSVLVLGIAKPTLASQGSSAIQNQAEQAVDQLAGEGTVDQIEGRAKEDIGRVQRQVDGTVSQTEGAAKQVQGRAQRDIGRTRDAIEDVADQAEDAGESLMDSIEDLFD